ncbi:MAG: helix-turn-helix domain-containing protein [Phycisphaerae bacterium]|nr:helix-turn-helix domain-containing protein [Phycisphaerae bacterium]
MRSPAKIKAHTTVEKMFQWLQHAPDEWAYKRRLAVWLTYTGKLHARQVAAVLGVSTQSVWLWIGQYNRTGPEGLRRKGRGGRRWGYLSQEDELAIVRPFLEKTRSGQQPQPASLKLLIEAKIGRPVSLSYVYRLLERHGWSDIVAQSRMPPLSTAMDDFKKLAMPWRRKA